MSSNLCFDKKAWKEYIYWQSQDKKTLKRINTLLEALQRNNMETIGKSEKLKGELSGCYSLRINEKDRLIYRIKDSQIQIIQLSGHYNDK